MNNVIDLKKPDRQEIHDDIIERIGWQETKPNRDTRVWVNDQIALWAKAVRPSQDVTGWSVYKVYSTLLGDKFTPQGHNNQPRIENLTAMRDLLVEIQDHPYDSINIRRVKEFQAAGINLSSIEFPDGTKYNFVPEKT